MKTEIQIGADIREFNSKMKTVQKTVQGIGETARNVTKSLVNTTAKIAKVTTGVGLAVGGGTFLASEKSFRKFENTMMQAFTLLPNANRQAFAKMKKDALEFSETYGISTDEVAAGLYQSLSAGIGPDRLFSFLATAQQAAIAGATDLRTSVDAFTNIMNAYGQDKYDTEYLADALFKGITMSKLTFEELSRYMYQAIPVAASLKVNIIDLVGAISALSSTGTLTRVGATQFRQMLVELQDHGSTANTIFRHMANGVSFQDFVREGGRLTEIMAILRKGAIAAKLDMGNLFSSIEAGNAARQLDTLDNFPARMKELDQNLFGSKNQAYDKMESALEMGNRIMKASFFNFFTRLGDVFSPAFETFYEFTRELSRALREDIDWQGMSESFERSWKVAINIANEGTDKLADYLKTHLKIAILEVYTEIVRVFDKATGVFAQLFGLDGSEFTSLLDSLVVVAKSFGKTLVDEFRSAMPQMITALAPLFSFISASIQSAIDNLNPFDRGENTKVIRRKKAEEFEGKEMETFTKVFQERPQVEEGLKMYANSEEQKENWRTRQNYQSDMLQLDTNSIIELGNELMRDMTDSTLGGLAGERFLAKDAKLKYKGNIDDMLEQLESDMKTDEDLYNKSVFGDSKLGSLNELLKSSASIKSPDIDIDDALQQMLPKEAIDISRYGDDDVDLSKIFDKDIFNPKAFIEVMQSLQSLASMPDEALLPIIRQAGDMDQGEALQRIDNIRDRLNSTVGKFGGFIYEVLATYHDAQVGLGKVQDIDPSEISFDERYNEALETIKNNVKKIQKYEDQHSKNRDVARKAERDAALKKLTTDMKAVYDEMGKIDISKISEDSPVLADIQEKIKANQAKVDAYNEKYGANIQLEDPTKADFGSFDLEKTNTPPEYEIRPIFREVVADSKQKIGAGGGTFNFASVQERLLNSQKILADTNKKVAEKSEELAKVIQGSTKINTPKPEAKTKKPMVKEVKKEKKEFSFLEIIRNTITRQKEKETEKESVETVLEKFKTPTEEPKEEAKPVQDVIQAIMTPEKPSVSEINWFPIEKQTEKPSASESNAPPIEKQTEKPSASESNAPPIEKQTETTSVSESNATLIEKQTETTSVSESNATLIEKQIEQTSVSESNATLIEQPIEQTSVSESNVPPIEQPIEQPKKEQNAPPIEQPKKELSVKEFFSKPIEQPEIKKSRIAKFFEQPIEKPEIKKSKIEQDSNPRNQLPEQKVSEIQKFFEQPVKEQSLEEKSFLTPAEMVQLLRSSVSKTTQSKELNKTKEVKLNAPDMSIANKRTAIENKSSTGDDLKPLIQSLTQAGVKIEYASNVMKQVLEKNKASVEDVYPITF